MSNEPSGASSQRGGSGNFASDRDKASDAGRKGSEHSHGGSQQGAPDDKQSSQRGGSGTFANDPEKASEAGRKGGEHPHGGR